MKLIATILNSSFQTHIYTWKVNIMLEALYVILYSARNQKCQQFQFMTIMWSLKFQDIFW